MPSTRLIAERLDGWLRTSEIPDYPGAVNGLQLENRADVTRIATAVDFSGYIVDDVIRAGAQLLLVHHGMFWSGVQPLVGVHYQRLAKLLENDIAVYSSHLPLDLHPELGNNVLLAGRLGLHPTEGFARYKTVDVGLAGVADVSTAALVQRASELASEAGGQVIATPISPERRTRRWAVCTGAGADSDTIREAVDRGIDTMIVGEGPITRRCKHAILAS
jgi:putative NIF3 family GTP cyclohydrolase 1 type 2